MEQDIRREFEQSISAAKHAAENLAPHIAEAADMIISALREGNCVYTFGNGGSAADAQHIASELVGRFTKDRKGFRAEALTTDASTLTSVSNDYGFEAIFARQLEAKASVGDVAVALSTSGNSPNVVEALSKAHEMGLNIILLTGGGGGKCAELADVVLDVPSESTPRIQEVHAIIYHIICRRVETALT